MEQVELIRTTVGMIDVVEVLDDSQDWITIRNKYGRKLQINTAHIVAIYYKEDENESSRNYDADATYG